MDEIDRISEDEEDHIRELEDIKKYVEEQKAGGNNMFISGWDDDTFDVEEEKNPKKNKTTHILWAAENGELEIVRQLVEDDPSLVSARDADGYTPLHRACYNNHVGVVEYLLAKGADHKATTNEGWTALHSAAHWNNPLCAVRLLENGADVNAKTCGEQTPLHLAAAHGASKETLELLMLHPLIRPNEINGAGETPYEIAKRSGVFYPMFEMFDPCVTELVDKRTDNT